MNLARIGAYENVTTFDDGDAYQGQERNNDYYINTDAIVTIAFYGSRALIRLCNVSTAIEVDADEARELISLRPVLDIPELLERERHYEKKSVESGEER